MASFGQFQIISWIWGSLTTPEKRTTGILSKKNGSKSRLKDVRLTIFRNDETYGICRLKKDLINMFNGVIFAFLMTQRHMGFSLLACVDCRDLHQLSEKLLNTFAKF